ncbi:HAD-IA family hydrolase [Paenibacillus sp. YPG26]|uniref:HAD family hydrolase n=1 Tax=Paenibacillus sp. YPG26 TaxID=2878915 RepID=UPI00203C5D8F|nr:HAD-IA family hydrolase [Paenibacillus sp. YPG26]USB34124.1 HAD-IA family hydrolase [Paenibacillus sp. YPG26]
MPKLKVSGREYEVDGILFDKDGTLLEFLPLWGGWAGLMADQVAGAISSGEFPVPNEAKREWLGLEMDDQGRVTGYDREGPLSIASIPEIEGILAWQLYKHGWAWNEAIALIRSFRVKAAQDMERERPVIPVQGLPGFLDQCSRLSVPLGVVTADQTAEAVKHLNWMRIKGRFKTIIGSDLVSEGKPSPEIIFKACRDLGISPDKAALIGDTGGDMQMGRDAGVAVTIGIGSGGRLPDAKEMISTYDSLIIN